jgi:hypothetical protein
MGFLSTNLAEQGGFRFLLWTLLTIVLLFISAACGNNGNNPAGTGTPPGTAPSTSATPGTGSQTPNPDEMVRVEAGALELAPDATGSMQIVARNLPAPGLAGFTIDIFYDSTVIEVVSVTPGDQEWNGIASNILESGEARMIAARTEGVTGESVLAVLNIRAVGAPGEFADVQLVLQDFVDSRLREISAVGCCGAVAIR